MNLLEYVFDCLAYLLSIGFILVAINGFSTGGAMFSNSLLLVSGIAGAAIYGYSLLTNSVDWYNENL